MSGFRVTIYDDVVRRECREVTVDERYEIASLIAEDARATAPVQTGEYKAGFGVEVDDTTVRAVNDDPEAAWKEYGTSTTPAHATLTNAARRYGKYSGVQPKRG